MFKKLFGNNDKQPEAAANTTDPMQLALATLFVEAARADEKYEDHEIAIIDKFLAAKFSLSPDEVKTLRAEAEETQANALDIQRYTKTAKEMSGDDKIAFIEQLWEIVLSDGDRDPFEDTLIRRICGLIYVEDRDSGAARARVAARLSAQPKSPEKR
ncbi:MAG: TerB family tellurite resistance protein [Alphaproteobacteria bacterium]|nr:TerB family tellurite resistance protein [Alphaproteobacteria bacterium]